MYTQEDALTSVKSEFSVHVITNEWLTYVVYWAGLYVCVITCMENSFFFLIVQATICTQFFENLNLAYLAT